MNITTSEYIAMETRLAKARNKNLAPRSTTDPVIRMADTPVAGGAEQVNKQTLPGAAKRIRQDKPMNKLETALLWHLQALYAETRFYPKGMRLRLANGLTYEPDIIGILATGDHSSIVSAHEAKGPHAYDGALDKLKMAAHEWPSVSFWLHWKKDGQWLAQEVFP
jgi:hypothetical protein